MTSNALRLVERNLVAEVRAYCDQAVTSGSKIPDETTLAAHFGVSRTKLREALACLEHEGAITRKPRVGIQANVDLPATSSRIDLQMDYTSTLAAAGYDARVKVVSADIVPATAETAERLGVETGASILSTRKVWFADDAPAMTAVDRIAVNDDLSVGDVDLQSSIFALVELLTGEPAQWEVMRPSAAAASDDIARLLGVDLGAPCLTMRTLGVSENGRRLFDSVEHHIPGVVDYGLVRTVIEPPSNTDQGD